MINYVDGNFVSLAEQDCFDVVCYSRNCFGVIDELKTDFEFNLTFKINQFLSEKGIYKDDPNKLGNVVYKDVKNEKFKIAFLYDHFRFAVPSDPKESNTCLDYSAFIVCVKKLNMLFPGQTFGFNKKSFELMKADINTVENILDEYLPGSEIIMVI